MFANVFGPAGLFMGLAIFIIAFEFCRPKRLPFDFLFMFNISYLVYFALAPIHIFVGGRSFVPLSMLAVYDENLGFGRQWLEIALAAVVIGAYALVLVGYYARSARAVGSRITVTYLSSRALYVIAVLFGAIGLISLTVYGREFDGIGEVVLKGALIRGGIETSEAQMLFLMHFIQFINCGSLIIFAVLMQKGADEPRRLLRLVFIFSIGLVFVAVLAVGARRSFILYSASLYFIYANSTGKRQVHVLVAMAVGFIALLVFGDQIMIGLSSGFADIQDRVSGLISSGSVLLYQAVWRDLTLPFVEFVGVVTRFEGWPRVFLDVPLAFLEAIPERLVPLELPALLVEESTELLSGYKLGDIVAIPAGFLGYGWYNGLLPGVIVSTLLFGWVGGGLELALRIESSSGAAAVLAYVLTGFTWAYSIRIGIPGMILNERFHWFALIFVLLFLSRITVSKQHQNNDRSRGAITGSA